MGTINSGASGGSRDYRQVPQTATTPVVPRRPNTMDLPFTGPGIGVVGMARGGNVGVSKPWVTQGVPPRSPVKLGGKGYI